MKVMGIFQVFAIYYAFTDEKNKMNLTTISYDSALSVFSSQLYANN